MATVLVKNGRYRNAEVKNTMFSLVKGFQVGKKGSYITVKNSGQFDIDIPEIKIKVESEQDYEITEGNEDKKDVVSAVASAALKEETDDEAMARIAARFEMLEEMTDAVARSNIRSLIVTGPPGVGKSFGVERQLEKHATFSRVAGRPDRYTVIKGRLTAIALYMTLYHNSEKSDILVFDDCDNVFFEEDCMNLLKGALDSGKRRRITWGAESHALRREEIPDTFDYKGGCIFITNRRFQNIRSEKIMEHMNALKSRSHLLDLSINTMRDQILRIKQVHRDTEGGLFREFNFHNNEDQEILDYMADNCDTLDEVSMRMALKIASLTRVNKTNWRKYADATCKRAI